VENSTQAVEYVDKGNQLLVSAKRIQRNTRKWACCALMILMAIIFVIVMAVLKPWETGAA
jgi:syntaxin 1B/2/3